MDNTNPQHTGCDYCGCDFTSHQNIIGPSVRGTYFCASHLVTDLPIKKYPNMHALEKLVYPF